MTTRAVERAVLICDRSTELAALGPPGDVGNVAIELLRAAGQDGTTLTHALGIGRSRLRGEPGDRSQRGGVQLLEAVVAFLGVKPRAGEVGNGGVPR